MCVLLHVRFVSNVNVCMSHVQSLSAEVASLRRDLSTREEEASKAAVLDEQCSKLKRLSREQDQAIAALQHVSLLNISCISI